MTDDQRVIEAGFVYEDDDVSKFKEFLKNHGTGVYMIIFIDTPDRPWRGTIRNFDFNTEDLYERLSNEFGNGKYYIQAKKGNQFIKEGVLRIVIDAPDKKKENIENNLFFQSVLKKIEALESKLGEKPEQQKDGELIFLDRMSKYKELLFPAQQNPGDSASVAKQMIGMLKEGMELGKTIVNPEPVEKDNLMGMLQGLLPLLPHFLNKNQNHKQPEVIEQVIPKQEEKEKKETPEETDNKRKEDEMKAHYLSLVPKLRWTASLPEGEEKSNKIVFIVDELFEFYPEIVEEINKIKSIDEAKTKFKQFLSFVDKNEMLLIERIFNDVKLQLKEDELDSKPDANTGVKS